MTSLLGASQPQKYEAVDHDPLLDDENDADAAHERESQLDFNRLYLKWVLPWALSTAVFAALAMWLFLRPAQCPAPQPALPGVFHEGFSTDFADARAAIQVENRVFTGALNYNTETQLVERLTDPREPQYFGPPSQAIDDAWHALLEHEYVAITEQEAAPWPELRKLPNTGHYHMEVGMFHSLHCLNAVRKAIDKDYYAEDQLGGPAGFHRIHMDHCLDQLRQAIECGGDLSPVPMFSWDGFNLALGIGQNHTCRRPQPVHAWMEKRSKFFASIGE